MDKVKILIVENELIIAKGIQLQLEKLGYEVTEIIDMGEMVMNSFTIDQPDLVLMDIHLAGKMDGIAAASLIRKNHNTPIIFLTSIEDHATFQRAKQTAPAVYLNKPFNEVQLSRHIELAIHNDSNNISADNSLSGSAVASQAPILKNFIWIKDDYSYKKLPIEEVLFIRASGSYCEITTINGQYTIAKNMREIEETLNHENFIKVHRSYCVNSQYITELKGATLVLENHQIPVGKTYIQAFKEKLKLL